MGKKSRTTETSKGECNIDYMSRRSARMNNQIEAFNKGKNVMVTIPNPNTNETNKRFIRVNAKDVWKSNNTYMMKQNTAESV